MQENTTKFVHRKIETSIDPLELVRQLLAHIGLILIVAAVCTAAAGFYTSYFVTPIYESTAKLYVLNSQDTIPTLYDLQVGEYLANDYIEVFNTWEVHETVIKNLDLPYTNGYMQDMLAVSNPSQTRILYITIKSPDPHEAMEIANEYAAVAIQFISKTMSTEEPNIMSMAQEPAYPSSPNMSFNLIFGFILGCIISIGAVTLRFVIDDKIKTADDIRKYTNLSVLSVVPTLKRKRMNSNSAKRGK